MPRLKKYTRDQVLDAIIQKFGSVEAYAKFLGLSKSGLLQKTMYLSNNFLAQITKDGLTEIIEKSTNVYSMNQSDIRGDAEMKKYSHSTVTEGGTEIAMSLVTTLKSVIDGLNKNITACNESLLEKNLIIKTLLEENNQLKGDMDKKVMEVFEHIKKKKS